MSIVDETQRLAFEDAGHGPPVILLHGFPFNRSLWNDQVEVLKDSYRVITPDLRGFGDTRGSRGPTTMIDMARDVASLMDSLEIERATIGGLSMGGYVVLAFYRYFKDRVKAIVLADTRPQADTEEAKKTRAEQAEKVVAEGMGMIVNAMLPKLLTPESVSKHPEVVKRVREMMFSTKPEGAASALLGMATREDQSELLPQIMVPTLILVGRDDAITPVADSETMHSKIPNSRLAIIESAGHVSNIEQADVFNSHLRTFLDQLS
jgi:pimeloyl-ACP methyl ester carboxylesterase